MRSIGEAISSKIKTFYKGPQNVSKTQAQKLMELEKEERLRDKVDTNVFYSENSGAAECFEYLTKHRSIFVATSTDNQIREIKDPGELETIETKKELTEKEKKNLDILFDEKEETISKVSEKILKRLSKEGRVKSSDVNQGERGLCFDNAQFDLLDNKPVFISRTGARPSPTQEVRNMRSLFLIPEDREKLDSSKIENWNISGISQKKEEKVILPSAVRLEDLNDAFLEKLETYYDQNSYYPTLDFGYIEEGQNKEVDDMIDRLLSKGNIVAVEGRAITNEDDSDYKPYAEDIKVLVDGTYHEKPPEAVNAASVPLDEKDRVVLPSAVKLEDLNDAFFEKLETYYDQNFYYPTLDFGYIEEGENKEVDAMIEKILQKGNIVAVDGRALSQHGYGDDDYEPYEKDIKVIVDGTYHEKPPESVKVAAVPIDEKDRVVLPSAVKLEDLNDAFFEKLETYYDQNFYYPTLDFGYIEEGENKEADAMIEKILQKGNIVAVEGIALSEHGYGTEYYEPYEKDIKVIIDGTYHEKPYESN